MIQIILTIIEDFAMAYFLSRFLMLEKKDTFFILSAAISIIETLFTTDIFNFSSLLPFLLILSNLILIKILKKEIDFIDCFICIIAPIIIILTDLLGLVIFSFIFHINIEIIVTNKELLSIVSFFSKILLIFIYLLILFIKTKNTIHASQKKIWIIVFIWFIIFLLIYTLGESIVYNNLNMQTIYHFTFLFIILILSLFIFFYYLYNEMKIKYNNELLDQKEYYINKNLHNINKMYDEIINIEHFTLYNLLYIKTLMLNNRYDEINIFLDKNISKLKKFSTIINTGSYYFDYMINKKLNEYNYNGYDIQTIVSVQYGNFNIEENTVEDIIKIIDVLFEVGDKNKTFSLTFSKKKNFLVIKIIFQKNSSINNMSYFYNKINKIKSENPKISYKKDSFNNYITYKILCELIK